MSQRLLEVERALQDIGWGQTLHVFAGEAFLTPYVDYVDWEIVCMLAASPIDGVKFAHFGDDTWHSFVISRPLTAAELDRLIEVIQAALVADRMRAQL